MRSAPHPSRRVPFPSRRGAVNSETAIACAKEIASNVIAPQAAANDREGRFSIDAVRALGETGLLGVLLPATVGGAQLGPGGLAQVTAILAEADPSVREE